MGPVAFFARGLGGEAAAWPDEAGRARGVDGVGAGGGEGVWMAHRDRWVRVNECRQPHCTNGHVHKTVKLLGVREDDSQGLDRHVAHLLGVWRCRGEECGCGAPPGD